MKTLIATCLTLLSAGLSLAQSCATCGASCACSNCPCPTEQVSVPQGVRYVYVAQARTCSNGVCTQQVVAFAVPDDAKPSAPTPKPAATFPKPMPGPGVTTTVETTKTRTAVLEGRHPLRRTFGSVGRFFFPWR